MMLGVLAVTDANPTIHTDGAKLSIESSTSSAALLTAQSGLQSNSIVEAESGTVSKCLLAFFSFF